MPGVASIPRAACRRWRWGDELLGRVLDGPGGLSTGGGGCGGGCWWLRGRRAQVGPICMLDGAEPLESPRPTSCGGQFRDPPFFPDWFVLGAVLKGKGRTNIFLQPALLPPSPPRGGADQPHRPPPIFPPVPGIPRWWGFFTFCFPPPFFPLLAVFCSRGK